MKIQPSTKHSSRTRERGVTLIECMTYFAVLVVVYGCGVAMLHRGMKAHRQFCLNTAQISQVLRAGEQWRIDVRSASGTLQFDAAKQALTIPTPTGHITYTFKDHQIERRKNKDSTWQLPGVAKAEFIQENRLQVTAWRWELQLASEHNEPSLPPLFSFTAVTSKP